MESKLSNTPLKIMSGTNTGPARARATFVEGEATDKKVPNASEHCTTNTITIQQITKREMSGFKLAIQ
jgi:hypothetical protein